MYPLLIESQCLPLCFLYLMLLAGTLHGAPAQPPSFPLVRTITHCYAPRSGRLCGGARRADSRAWQACLSIGELPFALTSCLSRCERVRCVRHMRPFPPLTTTTTTTPSLAVRQCLPCRCLCLSLFCAVRSSTPAPDFSLSIFFFSFPFSFCFPSVLSLHFPCTLFCPRVVLFFFFFCLVGCRQVCRRACVGVPTCARAYIYVCGCVCVCLPLSVCWIVGSSQTTYVFSYCVRAVLLCVCGRGGVLPLPCRLFEIAEKKTYTAKETIT